MRRDPTFRKFDKLSALLLAVALAWFCLPSSLFLRQVSMEITKGTDGDWYMTSVRRTPFGGVDAQWWAEYRVLGREDGMTCNGSGMAYYEPDSGDLARYRIGAWAYPCLEAGPPTAVVYSRQVRILGVPLRRSRYELTINPETLPLQPSEG